MIVITRITENYKNTTIKQRKNKTVDTGISITQTATMVSHKGKIEKKLTLDKKTLQE